MSFLSNKYIPIHHNIKRIFFFKIHYFAWVGSTIICKNIMKVFSFDMVRFINASPKKIIQCDYTKGATIVCFHPNVHWNLVFGEETTNDSTTID